MSNTLRVVNTKEPFAYTNLCSAVDVILSGYYNRNKYDHIVFACIGTDKAIGDSLGPLVGSRLKILEDRYTDVKVFGTLDNCLNAKTLDEGLEKIRSIDRPFVVAIDSCMGHRENVGFIRIIDGPISPGSGVDKKLPIVGDISIAGIVCPTGPLPILQLQNVELSKVIHMTNMITGSIKYSMWKQHSKVEAEVALLDEEGVISE